MRICPLYWIAVILLLIVQEGGGTFERWWQFLTLTMNFDYGNIATVDGPLWTVVVELHFYILLPLLAWVVGRIAGGSLLRAALFLGAIGALSLAMYIKYVTLPPGTVNQLLYHSTPVNFFWVIAGMELAIARLAIERLSPRWLAGPFGSADAWWLAALPFWALVWIDVQFVPALAVVSFLMLGALVIPAIRPGRLLFFLDWRPVIAVGVASYSLYVWHLPIVQNIHAIDGFPDGTIPLALTAIPAAILAGLLSYRIVETPFLRLRKSWAGTGAPRPAAPAPTAEPVPARSG